MKNKPFDREKALSGMECVSARGDSAYYKFTVNNHKDGKFHVFKLIEASTLSEAAIYVDDDGYVYAGGSNARLPESDLFMAPEPVEYWVATGETKYSSTVSGNPAKSTDIAISIIKNVWEGVENIQTHKITRYE